MLERKPWAHQTKAIEIAKNTNHYALFFEMGTGKTFTTIQILREKCRQEGRLLRTLILAPLIVTKNWKTEFEMCSKIKDITILDGSQKERLEKFDENTSGDIGHVFISNHEMLAVMPNLVEAIKYWHPEVLILDESHRFKDGTSKRTKVAISLSDTCKYTYILTGTPILNSPMDIFSQYRILDKGETFGKNFFSFRAIYFYDANAHMPKQNHFPNWKVRSNSIEAMNKLIYGKANIKAMRVTKDEALDLPDEIEQIIEVGMTKEQARMYEEMRDDFITFIEDEACTATLALTKALRLQQIASGFVKLENGNQVKIKNTPRQDALSDLLENLCPDHKVIVWAVFKENYDQIKKVCDDLKIKYVEAHGDISNADKFKNVDTFNQDPDTKVFIGHPGSGGIGINLVSSTFSIFFSRSFSLEQYLQAKSRNHRGGQTKKVTHIHLMTPGTIDEIVTKKLASKEEMGQKLLTEIKISLGKG